MNRFTYVSIAALSLTWVSARAGDGLSAPDPQIWPRWQGRIALQTSAPLSRPRLSGIEAPGLRIESMALLGDYYFTSGRIGRTGAGGFRATTGLLVGDRSSVWASGHSAGMGLSIAERGQAGPASATEGGDRPAPYVGIGYSGLAAQGGWGFAADLGLTWQTETVRFGADPTRPGQDETIRDQRLSPMLQLGINYSF